MYKTYNNNIQQLPSISYDTHFIRLNLVILVKQPKHIIIIPSFYIFENTVHICSDYIVNLESREPAKLFIQYP